VAAVNPGLAKECVSRFGVDSCSLRAMAEWMVGVGVKRVALEATGVYWMPVYELLESRGLEVMLVDGHQACNLPGRTKTDIEDAAWLEKLLATGMLKAAFVPEGRMVPLRTYRRHRQLLIERSSQEILRMQKALQQMNVRLDRAVTDITGVTGQRIIEAVLDGERDPKRLAELREPTVRKSAEEFERALDGTFAEHYLFTLKEAYEEYTHIQRRLRTVDARIEGELKRLSPPVAQKTSEEPPARSPKAARRKNQPHFELETHIVRLAGPAALSIPSVSATCALTVLSECGFDLSRWPTEKHFSSWLGLCSNQRITGGKVKGSKTRRVRQDAATVFRVCAQSLHGSHTALGAFLRRIARRKGMPKAITATAHKLAVLFYRAVRHGVRYDDPGANAFERSHQEKTLSNLRRIATKWGFELVRSPTPAAGVS
jgi:transposase